MSGEELTGEQIMAQNMAALESNEEMPHDDGDFPEQPEAIDEPEVEPEAEPEVEPEGEPEPISEEARKAGYRTKDEWVEQGGDPDEYLSEADFNKVGDLQKDKDGYTRHKLSKELVQTQRMVQEMMRDQKAMISDTEERVRNETIAKLKAEQKEAVDYGDTEKALEVEREINAEKDKAKKPEPAAEPEIHKVASDFMQSNDDWYNVHQNATDLINVELRRCEKNEVPIEEAFDLSLSKVKNRFPELFDDVPTKKAIEKPARPRATSEKSRVKPSAKPKKGTFNDLPPEMRQYAVKAAKVSGLTEAQYMEQMA